MPGCRLLGVLLVLALPAAPGPPAVLGAAAGRAVPDAYAPAPPPADLLPVPKEVAWGDGAFTLRPSTRVVLADGAAGEDLFAARELMEALRALGGPALTAVREREVSGAAGHILVGEPAAHPLVRRLLQAGGVETVSRPEGYVLQVTPAHIVVAGADRRGTFYGVQTLRQLLQRRGDLVRVPAVVIRDWPDHAVRAVHVLLDGASDPFHIALIDRILAPYKINTLVAEAETVQWESGRPFWTPDRRGATKAQVRRLLEAARQHHIQVIPLIATLGHSEWVFAGLRDEELCRQVAYIPRRLREAGKTQVTCDRARGVFPAVYDPERPVALDGQATTLNDALILPVLKEAVELFRPASLHLGHDEVRGPGGVRYDMDLYLRDLVTLAQFLAGAGVQPMVWGDVLWERRQEAEAEPLFQALPRDLVVVPWKYEDVREYPELLYFRQAGFPVLGATWYRLYNTYWFSRAGRAAGAMGMVRTTWTGQFQSRAALTRAYRQLYTYLTAAAYFWTADRPSPERAPSEVELARRFARAWEAPSRAPRPIAGTLLDLSAVATQRHIDADGTGWLGKGAGYDLRALRPGRQRLGGYLFEIGDPRARGGKSIVMLNGEREAAARMPRRVRVPVDGRAGCLVFLHATLDRAVEFGEVVGRYTMTLADGRRFGVDLVYGRDISAWLWDAERGLPSIEQEVVWSGRTRAGVEVLLQALRWENPAPATPVASIELASAGGRASPVVFAITALDRCP